MAIRQDLIDDLCRELATHGDPERALGQQRYMKSQMPYHGITSGELRRLLRPYLTAAQWHIAARADWEDTVKSLWDNATHREQRYAAQALLGHRSYRAWHDPALLPLLEHLITTGAWWDHVDDLSGHHVGDILAHHRAATTPTIRAWVTHEDLWLRRASIICQLGHRADTDLALLTDAIEANLEGNRHGSSFWIRKAIGWALRQHARTDPDWARAFVAAHEDRLSGLSRREALKHL